VDLGGVTYLNSSGCHVLAGAIHRLEADSRRLILRNPTGMVRRVLTITGFDRVFGPSGAEERPVD